MLPIMKHNLRPNIHTVHCISIWLFSMCDNSTLITENITKHVLHKFHQKILKPVAQKGMTTSRAVQILENNLLHPVHYCMLQWSKLILEGGGERVHMPPKFPEISRDTYSDDNISTVLQVILSGQCQVIFRLSLCREKCLHCISFVILV